MRGSPFLQAILVAIACLFAGAPVWRLTRPAPAAGAAALEPTAPAKAAPVELEVDFAPAPADFSIKNLGQQVLAGVGPQAHFTGRWDDAAPAEGVDLVVQARWTSLTSGEGAGPAAMRVVALFPDGRRIEKSFWSGANGALAEVFTLPGISPAP